MNIASLRYRSFRSPLALLLLNSTAHPTPSRRVTQYYILRLERLGLGGKGFGVPIVASLGQRAGPSRLQGKPKLLPGETP